jgi:hypothetical protein
VLPRKCEEDDKKRMTGNKRKRGNNFQTILFIGGKKKKKTNCIIEDGISGDVETHVSLCEMQEIVLPRGVLVDKVQKQQDGACDPPSPLLKG